MKNNILVFNGGGKYFFWNLGVAHYLNTQYDLSSSLFIGTSAGALSSVLTVCQVEPDSVVTCVEELCQKYKVYDRFFGLFGIWSMMVEEWLDMLLPINAHELCNHKVYIMINRIHCTKMIISNFSSRKDLIDCLLTTIHIPFFMNYFPFRRFRGYWCFDGSFCTFQYIFKIFGNQKYYYFHYSQDKRMNAKNGQLQTSTLKTLKKLIQYGFCYGETYSNNSDGL